MCPKQVEIAEGDWLNLIDYYQQQQQTVSMQLIFWGTISYLFP